jgi:hypothetical protein
MHALLLLIADALAILSIVLPICYAPFTKSALRGFVVIVFISFIWGILRICTIEMFREKDEPPLIAFVIVPFFYGTFGLMARGVWIVVCSYIRPLERFDDGVRNWNDRFWSHSDNKT